MGLFSWMAAKFRPQKEQPSEPVKKPRKPRRSKEEKESERAKKRLWLKENNKRRAMEERERQLNLGISHYKWQTSGDERTCSACAANDGRVFSWENPPITGHPGEGMCCAEGEGYCRCVAVAHFDLQLEAMK